MFCPKCGTKIDDENIAFCLNCGNKLPIKPRKNQSVNQNKNENSAQRHSDKKTADFEQVVEQDLKGSSVGKAGLVMIFVAKLILFLMMTGIMVWAFTVVYRMPLFNNFAMGNALNFNSSFPFNGTLNFLIMFIFALTLIVYYIGVILSQFTGGNIKSIFIRLVLITDSTFILFAIISAIVGRGNPQFIQAVMFINLILLIAGHLFLALFFSEIFQTFHHIGLKIANRVYIIFFLFLLLIFLAFAAMAAFGYKLKSGFGFLNFVVFILALIAWIWNIFLTLFAAVSFKTH